MAKVIVKQLVKHKTLHNNHLKQNKFTVSEEYFNALEDLVITKLKAELLNKAFKTNTPKNYFNNLENQVLQKVKQPKKSKIIKLLIPIAVAASLLVVAVLSEYKSNTESTISKNEIENWLNFEMVENTALDLVATQTDLEIEATFFETISNEDMVNYLNETDIENLLYEN